MTIIIGMKCKNGITLACDSRTTDPIGIVRDDAKKLNIIKFKDGNRAVIAESGNDDLSSRTVEIISSLAANSSITDYRSLADLSEQAVSEVKQQVRKQYHGTAEELQKHFQDYSFELMIAHYFMGHPYIFTLDFTLGSAIHKKRSFVSIGCGWVLADFLISPLEVDEFETGHALWTSIYAVEEIKKFDGRCGGKTRSAIISEKDNLSIAAMASDKWMTDTVREVMKFSKTGRSKWKTQVEKAIKKVVARKQKIQEKF